jgi:hypothetical protein
MSDEERYLLDADSLIRSKREHYALDFCPGFWDALLSAFHRGRVASIVPIRKELLRGRDALADWVKEEVPDEFFQSVETEDVQITYSEVIQWVDAREQYSRAAKQKFVSGADPALIAHARVKKFVLATYEVASPESKALIKLPDVARHFKVECVPPYVMLRRLKVVLALKKPLNK